MNDVTEPIARPLTPGRRRRADGAQTLRRVLDAAVATILEEGYYRSSSNRIAQRAGVTWGAIQHQFGTREGILLEVLDDGWSGLLQRIRDARIVGDTLEERLHAVLDVLATYYERPEHLAHVQILLDLIENPNTTAETRAAVLAYGANLQAAWQSLFHPAMGDAADDHQLISYAFVAMRGYLMGNALARRITEPASDAATRALLVRGVAAAVREAAAARGLDVDARLEHEETKPGPGRAPEPT